MVSRDHERWMKLPGARRGIHRRFIASGDHRAMHRIPMVALLLLAAPAHADDHARCPAPVIASVSKAYPKVTISACKPERDPERDHGVDFFEVVLARPSGDRLELDVAADGTILQVEESIAVDALPDPVKKAFAARYPRAKATAASKQTAGKDVRYEVAFVGDKARGDKARGDKARREATFSADGSFVEEE
jgi:hypothetical protein